MYAPRLFCQAIGKDKREKYVRGKGKTFEKVFRFPCRSGVNVFCAEHASQTVRRHERFFAPEVNFGRACAQARSFRSRFPSVESGGMFFWTLRKGCSLLLKAHRALRNGFPWQLKQSLRVWKDGLQKTNVSQRVEQRFSLKIWKSFQARRCFRFAGTSVGQPQACAGRPPAQRLQSERSLPRLPALASFRLPRLFEEVLPACRQSPPRGEVVRRNRGRRGGELFPPPGAGAAPLCLC